jgi:hypothetical protein
MDARTDLRPGEPHRALPAEAGKLCPYCRSPLHDREQALVCPGCHIPHHLECWIDNGRCTTYGCPEVAAPGLWRRLEQGRPFLSLRTLRPPPRERGDSFDMATYGFVLAFGWLFGPLALMLSCDLMAYLRLHPELPPPRRRRMVRLAWLGTIIGLLQIAVLVAGLIGFMMLLPSLTS